MKILFDTQVFDWQINGGISRYFIELINRLDTNPDTDVVFNCAHSYNTYIQNTKWLKKNALFNGLSFKGKLRIVKAINQVFNRRFSNKYLLSGNLDVFHPTYYDPYFLKYIGNKPFVLTVYDLTNEKFPDGTALTERTLRWKKELITKASHIIAISENTKTDVINYYKVDPAKITTIYLASNFNNVLKTQIADEIITDHKDYLLFVGSRTAYKNFTGFITEAAPVLKKFGLKLIVAGAGQFNESETMLLTDLGIVDMVVLLPHVSDSQLACLYQNATIFVFPSLYEGFGIPVLEAMQCRCPALLSNNSSLPEVGGQAAHYFDPFTKGDLAKQLETLILDTAGQNRMKEEGPAQAAKFNWDITALQHAGVYKHIINKKH